MVWGVGPSSCDLQVADSIPVAARSRDPPYRRGFGERMAQFIRGCEWSMDCNKRGFGRKLAILLTRRKNNNYYIFEAKRFEMHLGHQKVKILTQLQAT